MFMFTRFISDEVKVLIEFIESSPDWVQSENYLYNPKTNTRIWTASGHEGVKLHPYHLNVFNIVEKWYIYKAVIKRSILIASGNFTPKDSK